MKPQQHFDSNGEEQIHLYHIAAGGIAGRGITSHDGLGADACSGRMGFAASGSPPLHMKFKSNYIDVQEGGTQLTLKELASAMVKINSSRPSTFI
jgi:enoyl-[acyl-carrier protein] reductase II